MKKVIENVDFYLSLAHLFYAIASVDNRIESQEKKRINDLIETHWEIEIDGIDGKSILYSTLKKLFKGKMKSEEAYMVFSDFFDKNRESFSKELKKLILDNTTKIALSVSEINKSESILISRLYFLMKDK